MKKKIGYVAAVLVCLFLIETGRELVVFLNWNKRYEKAYWTIDSRRRKGDLTTAGVEAIIGPPAGIEKTNIETWYWDAANRKGPILRLIPLPVTRKTYRLSVEVNSVGIVTDIYSNAEAPH
jgi:hypothetical protein